MAGVRRSRTRSALLGLVILLVNASIVVAVVAFSGHRPTDGIELPPSIRKQGTAGTATSSIPPTESPSSKAAAAPGELAAADRPVTLAVLGDGTGDENGEWVQVLARMLGETHRVTIRGLDRSDPTRYTGAEKFGSKGPTATIWNGSRRGASADYAARRLEFLVPTPPDAVLLSYGRDDTASNIGEQLSTTYTAVRSKWPTASVLVVLQAPDRDDLIGPVRLAAENWAASEQLPTVDVAHAFANAGDPNRFVSVEDPPSVNSKGGRLWARTVLAALGADVSTFPDNGALPEKWATAPSGAEANDPASATGNRG